MLFSGIAEPIGAGSTGGFFSADSASCHTSLTVLATSLLIVSAIYGGDGMAGTWGGDVTWPFPSDRMIAGAKITDTMASTRSNAAIVKIARARGDSPLRVPTFEPGMRT